MEDTVKIEINKEELNILLKAVWAYNIEYEDAYKSLERKLWDNAHKMKRIPRETELEELEMEVYTR